MGGYVGTVEKEAQGPHLIFRLEAPEFLVAPLMTANFGVAVLTCLFNSSNGNPSLINSVVL
jgi:hypothetical protein